MKEKSLINGMVVKAVASRYKVLAGDGSVFNCTVRGRLKMDIDICAGDRVEIEESKRDGAVITKVSERKNKIIRPYVSNIDKLIIVIAKIPEPDFTLTDKLIISCYAQNIEPVLCLNKTDLNSDGENEKYFEAYKDEVKCFAVSCETGEGFDALKEELTDALICFAGQSATGKSSIINKLLESEVMKTGELSKRINRGKNTTRHVEIFRCGNGFLADTCGFSMMEPEIKSAELRLYYPAYTELAPKCKYVSCNHISEPVCAVKESVNAGLLSKERYGRYAEIFKQLKEKEDGEYA